jgi:putative hydrolase of the HAD superfamily
MENESVYNAWFGACNVVLFDLDGTMYDEWDYLSSAYRGIAKDLEGRFGISRLRIYQFLEGEFLARGRAGLFNKMIDAFSIPPEYLPEALSILRNVKISDKLNFYTGIKECLEWLIHRGKKIFIVTNGNIVQQKNKINHIEFCGLLKHIQVIYAEEIKPKPDPGIFFYLKDKFRIRQEEVVMVGDSPTDELFAAAAGISFIHANNIIHPS